MKTMRTVKTNNNNLRASNLGCSNQGCSNLGCSNRRLHRAFVRVSSFFLLSALVLLSSCDNPFRAGLGAVVDIKVPQVALTDPNAGDTIYGKRLFTGFAEDDYMIERVELMVTNYPAGDKNNLPYLNSWTPVTVEKKQQNKADWTLNIDTTRFPDGDLKVMVRAFDSVRQEPVEAGEYVLVVRNDLPKIKLTSPSITEDEGGDQGVIRQPRGGSFPKLNYGVTTALLTTAFPRDEMQARSSISGTIVYEGELNTDRVNKEDGKYPPQIRIWPISDGDIPGQYKPGVWPTEQQVPWHDFTSDEIFPAGLSMYRFNMKVPTVPGYYGFEIRAQSKPRPTGETVKFHYPRDFWPQYDEAYWDNPASYNGADSANVRNFLVENRYVLVYVETSETPAVVEFLDLQDIHGSTGWNSGTNRYDPIAGINDDVNHPYVDKPKVNKNGKFVVRVNARHASSKGIKSAFAFWESDKGEKGIFIWDPANTSPYVGWDAGNNVSTTDTPFSIWGYADPHDPTARNFIFTYDPAAYTLAAGMDNKMKGKSKIWTYTGGKAWEDVAGDLDGVEYIGDVSGWTESKAPLEEDTYTITVVAISHTGAVAQTRSSRSVRLDFQAPEVTLNAIDFEYTEKTYADVDYTGDAKVVNGVIRPSIKFSDARPEDSRERTATSKYGNYFNNGSLQTERFYLVVNNTNYMDLLISQNGGKNFWPLDHLNLTSQAAQSLTVNDVTVTVLRHGAIFGSDFMLKASEVYSPIPPNPNLVTPLGDGADYYLYVFSRDNAFNVGRSAAQKIVVSAKTDDPEIRLLGGLEKGATPSLNANKIETGLNGNHIFGSTDAVRLRLSDDDSLDLGVAGGAASGVTITITGSTQDGDGLITALTATADTIALTDTQVKAAFPPQLALAGGRQAVRLIPEGSISQVSLSTQLKTRPTTYSYLYEGKDISTLPDGIYKLDVTVRDYAPAKLVLPGETGTVAVKSANESIWIAVDTAPPKIEGVSVIDANATTIVESSNAAAKWIKPRNLGTTPPSDSAMVTGDGIWITGNISDRNGPVTVTGFTMHDGTTLISTGAILGEVRQTWDTDNKQYKAAFSAPVHIPANVSSTLKITLTVQDRFGKPSSFIYNCRVDTTAPTANLREPISVFERRDNNRMSGSDPGTANDKFTRLTNGVVRFIISATDNIKVTKVRYWLLPSGTAFGGWNHGYTGSNPTATFTDIALGHRASATSSTGKYGELTENFTQPIYINTVALDDTPAGAEFVLYVMALDDAENTSVVPDANNTTSRQPIYVLQSEDRPYFGHNPLSGVVGGNDMVLSLPINDDDGFYTADGTGVRAGTIRMWLTVIPSTTNGGNLPGTVDINNDTYLTDNFVSAGTISTGITQINRQNINLNINLKSISAFTSILNTDGKVYYVVEATDSWYGKYTTETGTPATNNAANMKTWRQLYTFEKDENPPVVTITQVGSTAVASAQGKIFPASPTDFSITGTISDAHLKKASDGNYIIGIRLDSDMLFATSAPTGSSLTPFKLGTGNAGGPYTGFISNIATNAAGITTVTFTITNAALIAARPNGIGYTGIESKNHTLVISAEDESGQSTNSASYSFIKDALPPTFTFTRGFNDAKTEMPRIRTNETWWTTMGYINLTTGANMWNDTDRANYRTRRDTLPTVTHDGTSAPSISGTFTDTQSNIDNGTFKIGFDGVAITGATATLPQGQLEGDGKSIRWTVYLTTNGQPSTNPADFLSDGVHSIQLEVKDAMGNTLTDTNMYGFRIVSETPTATLTPPASALFGDRSALSGDASVFTITGNGKSSNLKDVRIRIRYTDSNTYPAYERLVTATGTPSTNPVWSYSSTGIIPKLVVTDTLSWSLEVPRSYIAGASGGLVSGLIREGNYEIRVIAIDSKDKLSDETSANTWSFMVDSGKPTFSFNLQSSTGDTTPNADNSLAVANRRGPTYWLTSTTTRNARNVLSAAGLSTSDGPSIKGRVSDSNNLDAVQLQFARWNYDSGASGAWEIYRFSGTGANTFVTGDATNAAAADFWQTLASSPSLSSQYPVDWKFTQANNTTPITLTQGYYSVRLRARDSSRIGSATLTWAEANGGNPVESQFVYFFIDSDTPVVENPDGTAATSTFSTRNRTNYGLPFSVRATDINMFEKMEYAVERVNTTGGTLPASNAISNPKQSGTGSWTPASLTIPFTPNDATNGLPDGAYRVTFTATDLAGKVGKDTRTITLDNTAPTAKINEPRFVTVANHIFASDIRIGGEKFDITGETDDQGPNGSASGPKEIWYRIGYGTQSSLPAVTSSMTAAQRSAAIMAWAVASGSGLTGVPTTGNRDTGAAYNKNFDNASKTGTTDSLWFKYKKTGDSVLEAYDDGTTSTNTYDVPTLFGSITSDDPYRWTLPGLSGTDTVARNYALGSVTIRGRNYVRTTTGVEGAAYGTGANAQYLARRIAENTLPTDMQGKGLYSLPLVIRVVDNAGNVFYELRDIWLYPNGDNPSSRFLNPEARFTGYTGTGNGQNGSPRGGQFSIEGIATDNVSVRNVIYRVKVDGTTNTTTIAGNAPLDTATGTGGTTNIVTIPGATAVVWTSGTAANPTMDYIWNQNPVVEASGSGALTKTGWYYANLESANDVSTSWNFMINSGQEISNLISTKGFSYNSTTGFNLIRVWVEVLVFDGATVGGVPHLMSLGDSTNASAPRPYVREFYLTASAPSVTTPQISNLGSTTAFSNYTSPLAESNVRGGNFAIRATLNGNSSNIGEISVKLRNEDNSDWRNIPLTGTLPTGASLTWPTANRTATLTYVFNSTAPTSTTQQTVRGGAWSGSGGTYTIDVRVRDSNNPPSEATYTFEVGIDNFAPVADTVKEITPTKVAGSNVSFLGRVFDYQDSPTKEPTNPPHKKIQKVEVWFTSGTGNNLRYIKMDDGTLGTAAQAGANNATTGIHTSPTTAVTYSGDKVTNITVTRTGTASRNIPTGANYVKLLQEGALGATWAPDDSRQMDIYWNFAQNTTYFPDGWIVMHYVITDQANNQSYYTQNMIVMNKYPKITNVTLYTNNTGEGAVFTTHEGNEAYSEYVIPDTPYASGYLNSEFIAKNRVLGFGVETTGGNAPLNYRAQYVERYRVPLTDANLRVMAERTGNLTYYTGLTGTASTTLAISNFADVYTVTTERRSDNQPGLDTAQWRILGVPSATATNGTHFVFQGVYLSNTDPQYGADNNVATMGSLNAVVYAYRTRLTPKESLNRTGANANSIPLVSGQTSPLTFQNGGANGDFSDTGYTTNRIPEALHADSTANSAGATNDRGTVYFLIKVWDTVATDRAEKDRLYDALVIGTKVYLSDGNRPFARLYDLNPYMETTVIGNNLTTDSQQRTRDEAAAPTAVGTNVKRGGLYNVNTARDIVKSGYIDPRAGSSALNPYVSNPNDSENPYKGSTQARPNWYVDGDDAATGPARDQVSGTILLRGLAWDDQLIDEINVTIGTVSRLILKLRTVRVVENANGTKTETIVPDGTTGGTGTIVRKMMPESGVEAWAAETIHWQTGHTVEWAYLWNTETLPIGRDGGGPSSTAGVAVAVSVKDLKGTTATNPSTSVSADNPTANPPVFHNTVNVDIVPYVTGLKRADTATSTTPAYSTTRSRQGWYSFFQGETGIRVQGYNLGSAALTVNLNSTGAGAGTNLTSAYANSAHTFAITPATGTTTLVSGRINVTSGSTEAYNHTSAHASKSWNREYSEYIDGSDLWNNKPYAHIWATVGSADAPGTPRRLFAQSGGVETPGMTLQYVGTNAGRLHGAWANSGEDSVFYADSSATARTLIVKAGEPYSSTDINFWNGTGTIPGTNRAITDYASVVMSRQADGNPLIRLKTQITAGTDHRGGGDETTYIVGPQLATAPTATNRWQNIRLSKAAASTAEANPGRVFVTAYDSSFQRLFFTVRNNVTMTKGTNSAGTTDTANNAAAYYLDGTNTNGLTAPNNGTAASLVTGNATGSIAAVANAGEYSAIDYDSYGRPVIAYYDGVNETLRLLYANSNNPTTAAAWTRRYVLTSTDPLYRGSGTYVSMKIQRAAESGTETQGNNDIIHLAFFNNVKNTLVYARGTRAGTFTTYTVDTVVKGGMYTDISLDSGNNPWIVYADSTRIGSNGGARIAYRDSSAYTRTTLDPLVPAATTPTTDYSRGWEALTMPAQYNVNRDRLNIEAWPPQAPTGVTAPAANAVSWNAAIGYGSDFFRLGYFNKPDSGLMGANAGFTWQAQAAP